MGKKEISFKEPYCTVKKLKEYFEKYNVPGDAIIMMQRVEDKYFEAGWETIKKKGCLVDVS